MTAKVLPSFTDLSLASWPDSSTPLAFSPEIAGQIMLQSIAVAYRDAMIGAMLFGAFGPAQRPWSAEPLPLPTLPDAELEAQLRALRAAQSSVRGPAAPTSRRRAPSPSDYDRKLADYVPQAPKTRRAPTVWSGPHDGKTPAPGTTVHRKSAYNEPPLTNDASRGRSRETYDQVINQFAVGTNPRYAIKNGSTYCNIFAWDVTRAMGAEIPHWVKRDGSPAKPFEKGAHELNANDTQKWLTKHGEKHGWKRVSAEEAQKNANEGKPSVVIMAKEGGIGHVSVVRPGEVTDKGPAIAQAGARNFNEGHVHDVWRKKAPVEYWVHE